MARAHPHGVPHAQNGAAMRMDTRTNRSQKTSQRTRTNVHIARARRGFSLMEILVALAIGGIVTAVATGVTVQFNKTMTRLNKQSEVGVEARLLLDRLSARVQQVGGGAVRPWDAIELEDGAAGSCSSAALGMPACNGADRLRFLELYSDASECVALGGSGSTVNFNPAACCLTMTEHNARNMVYVPSAGGGWKSSFCTATVTSGTCRCNMAAGGGFDSTNVSSFSASYAGGVVAVARTSALYLDRAAGLLYALESPDGATTSGAPRVARELADRVVDLQFQLGFDESPVDGHVDTWRHNIPAGSRSQLRVVRIGVIVSGPTPGTAGGDTISVLDGPARTVPAGQTYRAAQTDVQLRNVLIFQ